MWLLRVKRGVLIRFVRVSERAAMSSTKQCEEPQKVKEVCKHRANIYALPDLLARNGELNRTVHVINVEIKDNHEEALVAGKAILELCRTIDAAENIDEDIAEILDVHQAKHPHALLHTVLYY